MIWAAMNGHTEVVKALIEKGADVDAKEKVGRRCCVSTGVGGLGRNTKFLLQHVGSVQTNWWLYSSLLAKYAECLGPDCSTSALQGVRVPCTFALVFVAWTT
jgi:hypothetical protein